MGGILYNGLAVPARWPPLYGADEFGAEAVAQRTTTAVPYLLDPPAVIPIDVGRQLFVDDFLIERTSLRRVHHRPTWHPDNPVLRPDRPWEQAGASPTAMPFSDGVWYDPADNLFKMWYMAGFLKATAYATSQDGIRWEKPDLDVAPWEGRPSNIVHPHGRDSCTVWMDREEPDPSRRFKMVYRGKGEGQALLRIYLSGDGIHWDAHREGCDVADRSTVFFNPFRRVWVFSIKDTGAPVGEPGRFRRYREHADLSSVTDGSRASRAWVKDLPLWSRADSLDPRRPELDAQPELYNLDAVAYESLMLGLFTIWPGQPENRPKPNYVAVGFSRDGFHWHRPDRRPFLGVSETFGDWNWGNVQSAGGGCLVVGDRLYFYVSGRAGEKDGKDSGVCATGLATLRRDGFASMDADDREGTLTTRLLTFKGNHLFVNAAVREGGALRAGILDADGKAVAPFTPDRCRPITTDSTRARIDWKNERSLSTLAGKPVRIRFSLTRGSLYAFWVSPDVSGASHGYVAAGGPGFPSSLDTGERTAHESSIPGPSCKTPAAGVEAGLHKG